MVLFEERSRNMSSDSTFGEKAAFVRACPKTMAAKEVVEAAKNKGIQLTTAYVSNVRWSTAREAAAKKKGPKKQAAKVSQSTQETVLAAFAERNERLQGAAASAGRRRDEKKKANGNGSRARLERIDEVVGLIDRLVAEGVRERLMELVDRA